MDRKKMESVGQGGSGVCNCMEGGTLAVLSDVHKAYEERMEVIDRVGGCHKLKMQVEVLRSWVDDLLGQNTLLARVVTDLEQEATSRLTLERSRHAEVEIELRTEAAALRRRLARKESDLRGLVEVLRRLREFDYCTLEGIHFFEVTESDIFGTVQWRQKKLGQGDNQRPVTVKKKSCNCSVRELTSQYDILQKENLAKEREIRKLNRDVQKYEQTILNLRTETPPQNLRTIMCAKKDAEVMVGMCCTKSECIELEGVNYGGLLKDESIQFQDRVRKMEQNLKGSGEQVRALRKVNVALSEELHAVRRVCAALDDQLRSATTRTAFKDDIIREMRRQLKQAKAKLKDSEPTMEKSPQLEFRSVTRSFETMCSQPRRLRAPSTAPSSHAIREPRDPPTLLHPDSDECRSPRFDGSGDDCLSYKADD